MADVSATRFSATKPAYVLLAGRTTYDYRNFEGLNVDRSAHVPDLDQRLGADDVRHIYADLGRGYPELSVGRPCERSAELRAMVNRVLNYQVCRVRLARPPRPTATIRTRLLRAGDSIAANVGGDWTQKIISASPRRHLPKPARH
jgi:hypothetical protein